MSNLLSWAINGTGMGTFNTWLSFTQEDNAIVYIGASADTLLPVLDAFQLLWPVLLSLTLVIAALAYSHTSRNIRDAEDSASELLMHCGWRGVLLPRLSTSSPQLRPHLSNPFVHEDPWGTPSPQRQR